MIKTIENKTLLKNESQRLNKITLNLIESV